MYNLRFKKYISNFLSCDHTLADIICTIGHKFAKLKILDISELLQKIRSFDPKRLNFLRSFEKKLLKKLRSFDGNFLFFEVV